MSSLEPSIYSQTLTSCTSKMISSWVDTDQTFIQQVNSIKGQLQELDKYSLINPAQKARIGVQWKNMRDQVTAPSRKREGF